MSAPNATNSVCKEADAEEEHSGIPKAEFIVSLKNILKMFYHHIFECF